MSSQPRTAREEERRVNIRTLAIASIASAAAAVVTSQFWIQGTWMAAAITPVIVALISEMLHRPTEVIAERVTSRGMSVLPATRGPAAPRGPGDSPDRSTREEEPAPAEPGSRGEATTPPVRVYKSGADKPLRPRASRRKIAVGVVAVTAVLAFAIAAVAMTGTELLTGGSIGKGEGDTTLFSGNSKKSGQSDQQQDSQPEESAPAPDQPESGGGEGDQPESQPEQPSEEPPAEEQPSPTPEAPDVQTPQQQP
jgi:hypothetical protein